MSFLDPHAWWVHWNSVLMGHGRHCDWGSRNPHAHTSSAHVRAPLSRQTSLTQHKLKIKLLQISVCRQQSIKPNGGPSEYRALCNYTGCLPVKPALSSTQPHWWSMSLPLTDETAGTHTEKVICPRSLSLRPSWDSSAGCVRPHCLCGPCGVGGETPGF